MKLKCFMIVSADYDPVLDSIIIYKDVGKAREELASMEKNILNLQLSNDGTRLNHKNNHELRYYIRECLLVE